MHVGVSEWYFNSRPVFLGKKSWKVNHTQKFQKFLRDEMDENLCKTPLEFFTPYFCEHYFKDKNTLHEKLTVLKSIASYIPKYQLNTISNIILEYIKSLKPSKSLKVNNLLKNFESGARLDYDPIEYFFKIYVQQYIFDIDAEFETDLIDGSACLQAWNLTFDGNVPREVYNLGAIVDNITISGTKITCEVTLQLSNDKKHGNINPTTSYGRVLFIGVQE